MIKKIKFVQKFVLFNIIIAQGRGGGGGTGGWGGYGCGDGGGGEIYIGWLEYFIANCKIWIIIISLGLIISMILHNLNRKFKNTVIKRS